MVEGSLFVKPFSGKRAFEEIADQIRNLIYAKKLKPGDKLPPERDLAEMFNAGRTAVRESLRILRALWAHHCEAGERGWIFCEGC